MAYDLLLADRVRAVLPDDPAITEKKMFGGLAWLLHGKMFCGVVKTDLMVRVGKPNHDAALAKPHARPMDFTGKPMAGYVFVSPEGLDDAAVLASWVEAGRLFVAEHVLG